MTSSQPKIDIKSLQRASREPVVQALSGFAGKPVNCWLPPGQPGATGQFLTTRGKPYSTYAKFKKKFTPQQVLDVLAATGPSHCLDGWTFLSRALAALLSGDTHTARHLAYYAQLRSALSLLHCHGIGIFNGVNFAVDTSGTPHCIDDDPHKQGSGTHSAAWAALCAWADHIDTANVFLNSVQFRGVSLRDCIDAVWPSAVAPLLVSKIIETWGVDLKRSAEERESRNISSYCAHAFNEAASNLSFRLDLVQSIWRGLEPDGRGGFPTLDRHLLRRFLELMKEEHSKITTPPTPPTPPHNFWDTAFPRLDPKVRAFVTQDFLEHKEQPSDLPVFSHADSSQPGDVHAMVSRALLLLRTATAVVRSAFVDAQFNPLANNLQPWFNTVGVDRGFWSDNQPPERFEDLWDVVSYAVEDLAEHVSTNLSDQFSFFASLRAQSVFLSQTERACIWGVGV